VSGIETLPPERTVESVAEVACAEAHVSSDNTVEGGHFLQRSLGPAIVGVSVIAAAGKLSGFAEKVVIAKYFGTAPEADVYFAVMGLVWSLVYFVRELLIPTLLPVFRGAMGKHSDLTRVLFRTVFMTVLALLTGIALTVATASRTVAGLALPGFGLAESAATSRLIRVVAPGAVCLGMLAVTYTCLNARKRFVASAFGDALFKLLLVGGLLALLPRMRLDAPGPVIAAAALIAVAVHLFFLPERRSLVRKAPGVSASPHLRKMLRLMAPLFLGAAFSHVSVLVDNLLASHMPRGQLSHLAYGKKLVDAAVLIGPVAVATVVYSHLTHLCSEGRMNEVRRLTGQTARLLIYIAVPMACLIAALRLPLVRMLFERGKFDAASSAGTAAALFVYSLGLVAFALEAFLVYCFFAMSDTKTPVFAGIVFVLIDIVLAVALLERWQYLGIAAAFVVSKTAKVACLAFLLRRKIGGAWHASSTAFVLKVSSATVVMWYAIDLTARLAVGTPWTRTPIMTLLLPAAAGAAGFLGCSFALGLEEPRRLAGIFTSRLKSRRKDNVC